MVKRKKENFVKIIKDLRRFGFTQIELAERCEVSRAYISQLAVGHRQNPGYEIGKELVELRAANRP